MISAHDRQSERGSPFLMEQIRLDANRRVGKGGCGVRGQSKDEFAVQVSRQI